MQPKANNRFHQWLISNDKKAFILIAALYIIVSFSLARKIDFESYIFCPFRYEGLLFFKNAFNSQSGAFFFIRDWSTSNLSREHPLLYFHNLDLVHLFAGSVQSVFMHGKIILFVLSTVVGLIGLRLVWWYSMRNVIIPFSFVFFLFSVLPPRSFGLAPQNLFIALSLLTLIWHFRILKNIFDRRELGYGSIIEIFLCFLLSAMVETNQTILMTLILIFFVIYSYRGLKLVETLKKGLPVIVASVLPSIILRIIQLISVIAFGFFDKYKLDLAYTSKLKVNSNINLVDSIAFYAKSGITYFGQDKPSRILVNLESVNRYFVENFGGYTWYCLTVLAVVLLLTNKRNRIMNKISFDKQNNTLFMCSYLVFFTLASYLLVFLSGDAILKISMSTHGVLNYCLLYIPCYALLIPCCVVNYLECVRPNCIKRRLARIIITIMVICFVFACKDSILKTRSEKFGYKEALAHVRANSDIITNYEPSTVAIESSSRVSMSWFESVPTSCDLTFSSKLIRMYKVNQAKDTVSEGFRRKYAFLAYFPPYGSRDKDAMREKHCVSNATHKAIYEDRDFGLYEIR